MKYEFLLSSLKLPVVNADYRFDLDGSGATDDQLGETIAALIQQGLDMQAAIEMP